MGVKEWFPSFFMQLVTMPTRGRPQQAAFRVSPKMTKLEVKEYLLKVYGVPVKKVMTQNFLGKRKRIQGSRSIISYKRPDFKKAIVTLDLEKMSQTDSSKGQQR
ncbi:ribosomal protein L23/L15e core domain-containing protein [Tribonema minus]|uniref:Large ribosomal subunit protein uL23m n=1 Tax=Tribonema minus TaxID=303371 RepID=A0A835YVT8_9STRA|nr:ribosomal protein L23/L15e core domain-containing protein [Tribonema minus]|eukprot:TRINITY_DN2518_c0_g1_i1.p2 TRINITY_DN2518_c0_g1~~TRINITY_DN2518_c0_g1_i1.p2  ORF type:complete len:104 (-),score=25.50 TRINITY_DN2518_c0_g1_i1:40-351(-)